MASVAPFASIRTSLIVPLMPTAERTSLVLVATKTSKKGVWRSNSSIYLTHRDGRYPAFPDFRLQIALVEKSDDQVAVVGNRRGIFKRAERRIKSAKRTISVSVLGLQRSN